MWFLCGFFTGVAYCQGPRWAFWSLVLVNVVLAYPLIKAFWRGLTG